MWPGMRTEDIEMKTITYNPETHVLVPREPSQGMIDAMPPVEEIGYWAMYEAAIAAAPQPEQVESEPVPDFRGYAALGTGQYLLDACPATKELPPELVISVATEEEKVGRIIGDLMDVKPGTELDPKSMAVRLAFFSVAGLDALEQQLRILREESFPNTTPQPDRTAELEAALKEARDGIDEFLVANDPTEFGCACDLSVDYLCGPCHADKQQQPLKSALAKINEVLK